MARALGRYELLRPLARGGMADVYLARRRAAGVEKWLVVKRMRPETSRDPRFLDLFVREARLSMSLVHQNIVPVFDFGKIDDQVFLAMERVEGKDLGSSLARATSHRLPPLLAAFIAAECCQALDYAHQRKNPEGIALGIVHRDVTPRNVLLSWSGEVKLTDFGIAALAGDATSRLLGTPQYMAPEQARSEAIDPRADIYAVGLVLREAVSGSRPRPGGDRDTILDAARRGVLLPWAHLAGQVPDAPQLALGSGDHGPLDPPPDPPPPALVAIIDRATAPLAGNRYPDARSMLEDLDSFIVGERAAHKAESPSRQLAAWLARVWEGARDDVETDAAIDADHLVSFLDDGALDVLGTGTVRSLAATAAEDVHIEPPAAVVPRAPAGSATPAPRPVTLAPPITADAISPASARPGGTARRPSRISSSNATVASGSFHTIAIPDAGPGKPAQSPDRRKRRRSSPLASLLFVGLSVGAVAFLVTTRYRARDAGPPRPEPGQPRGERPDPERSAAAQPTRGQPTLEPQAAERPAPEPPAPSPPNRGAPGPGSRHDGPPTAAPPTPGQPHADPLHRGSAHAGRPTTGPPNPGQPQRDGDSSAPNTAPTERPAQAVCRVRINLTPWAYYTADDNTTRHETPGTIDLTPGPHRLHVWNPELHVERDITINVPADRDAMNYSEPLQPPTSELDAGVPR